MVIDQVLYPLSVAPLAIVRQNEKCRKEGEYNIICPREYSIICPRC